MKNFGRCKKGFTKIEGRVVLRKASLLDVKDIFASVGDHVFELLQQKVNFQLISSDEIDQEMGQGKRSRPLDLQWKYLLPSLEYVSKDLEHRISVEWAPEMGILGAVMSYLPDETSLGLVALRNVQLVRLRGNGTVQRNTLELIYDYNIYNDLGDPDMKKELERKVLGGSQELPYPTRCRTGRPRSKTSNYVPAADELDDQIKV